MLDDDDDPWIQTTDFTPSGAIVSSLSYYVVICSFLLLLDSLLKRKWRIVVRFFLPSLYCDVFEIIMNIFKIYLFDFYFLFLFQNLQHLLNWYVLM